MRKQLSPSLTLYFNDQFPCNCTHKSSKKHIVILGIGGNIGNVKRRFNKLFFELKQDCRFDIIKTSPLLKNPPFGYLKQDDFLNGLIKLKTNLSAILLLNEMQRYEKRFRRVRRFKDAPRTLDIDIIFYDDLKLKHPRLSLPHPKWQDRQSVTIPLKYL